MGKKKKAVSEAAAREHELHAPARELAGTRTMQALGPVAKLTDEPPLLALGLGTLALGAVLRRPALARSGARMVASHLLATGLKTILKASVDRARPNAAGGRAHLDKGHGADDSNLNAFPSGHTAGATAIAQSVGREVPGAAIPVRLVAGAAGALQVGRGAHYVSDVAAGAAIGWLSEQLASRAIDAAARWIDTQRDDRAEAEVEAHPS